MTPYARRDVVAFLGQVAAIGCMVLAGWCVEYVGTLPRRACIGLGVMMGVLLCQAFDILREYRDGERR